MLDDLLLRIQSMPMGQDLPSPWEILHNHTEECPRHPPHQVNFEHVKNYLIDKKVTQTKYCDKSHNVKPLLELKPHKQVLFLSPTEQIQYIGGKVTTKAATPRSYFLETQGKTYHWRCQHTCTINANTTSITRPNHHKTMSQRKETQQTTAQPTPITPSTPFPRPTMQN